MKSWTIEKVSSEFSVTKHTVHLAQELQKECCMLPSVPLARGKLLAEKYMEVVNEFARNDYVSRVMPGEKGGD